MSVVLRGFRSTRTIKNMCDNKLLEIVRENIKTCPDFPKPGVLFRDLFPVLKNPKAFNALSTLLDQHVEKLTPKPEIVVGLDARGFLFGPIVALQRGIPFVPIRKKGKLPGKVHQETYVLEYGTDTLEIQSESILPGQKVLIVDDLLATGGTLGAACKILKKLQADVVECLVIMELKDLKGREVVDAPVHAFFEF